MPRYSSLEGSCIGVRTSKTATDIACSYGSTRGVSTFVTGLNSSTVAPICFNASISGCDNFAAELKVAELKVTRTFTSLFCALALLFRLLFPPPERSPARVERRWKAQRVGRRPDPRVGAHGPGPLDVLHNLLPLGGARRRVQDRQPVVRPRHGPVRQQRPQCVRAIQPHERAAPGPVLCPLRQRRPYGVAFHVPQHRQEMIVLLDREALEAALVQVPVTDRRVRVLPPLGVRQRQPPHEGGQLAVSCG